MISPSSIKNKATKAVQFLLNPRFLLCFGIAWLITNGWSYIMLGVGTYFGIGWMIAVATAYLAFLWLPVSPEKIVTVLIAMALLRFLFPHDLKTLGILRELHEKLTQKQPPSHKGPSAAHKDKPHPTEENIL